MRKDRVVVRVTTDEQTTLRLRAKAHSVGVATYVRNVALGRRPDGDKAKDADAWWDAQSPSRRAQVHRWLTRPDAETHDPGQTAMDLPGSEH